MRQLVVRYLVKWKGYGVEEATWERADSLRLHAQDSIDDYERRAGGAEGGGHGGRALPAHAVATVVEDV